MKKYTVAQVGCGVRGKTHLDAWLNNQDRFKLVGLCELDEAKMQQVVQERNLQVSMYDDAEKMLRETRPDIFCFVTLPDLRLKMVELAAKYKVMGIAFEKPMATSLSEARKIVEICRKHKIKAIVSHQQKYTSSFVKLKSILDAGSIGKVERINATCQGWLTVLGTHFIDYALWANNNSPAIWVVGHVHGRELLSDHHPSPNYVCAEIMFRNKVRVNVSFGRLSSQNLDNDRFWMDNRLTVYGSHGYVWCETDGRWGTFNRDSNGEMLIGHGEKWEIQIEKIQKMYVNEFIEWLDDDAKVHSCNVKTALAGYEILDGICLSALKHCRIDLPLKSKNYGDVFDEMRKTLPECPELLPLNLEVK